MFDNLDGPDWHARAACHPDHGHDPDYWWPEGPGTAFSAAYAIAICNDCPTRSQCLTDALAEGQREGIWGGVNFTADYWATKHAVAKARQAKKKGDAA